MRLQLITLVASLAALAAPVGALAQTAPDGATARLTPVRDPVVVCEVMLIEAMATEYRGAGFDPGRPRVSRDGEATLVTWRRMQVSGERRRPTAVCRAEPEQISSLKIGGVEQLTQPQPY